MALKPQKPEPKPMAPITADDIAKPDSITPQGKVRVYVLRATWVGEQRFDVGTALDLPIDEAMARIENGIVSSAVPDAE